MGDVFVELLVRVGLTTIVFIIFGVMPSKMALLFPFMVLPLLLLTWGLGFFLALLAGLFRDMLNIVSLITSYLLFLMPVAYPPPASGILAVINRFNPVCHIIVSCREMVLYGKISNPSGYLFSSVFCLVVFLLSWRLFHMVEARIVERI